MPSTRVPSLARVDALYTAGRQGKPRPLRGGGGAHAGRRPREVRAMAKRILVIDVGGTHVKLHVTGHAETLKIPSGKDLTPRKMLRESLAAVAEKGWRFDAISVGIPAPIIGGRVALEPVNLGRGWTRFDFVRAARKPIQLLNDAAMQALGSYRGKG